jgi:hypothetical protein
MVRTDPGSLIAASVARTAGSGNTPPRQHLRHQAANSRSACSSNRFSPTIASSRRPGFHHAGRLVHLHLARRPAGRIICESVPAAGAETQQDGLWRLGHPPWVH